jgi:hypothetical protein
MAAEQFEDTFPDLQNGRLPLIRTPEGQLVYMPFNKYNPLTGLVDFTLNLPLTLSLGELVEVPISACMVEYRAGFGYCLRNTQNDRVLWLLTAVASGSELLTELPEYDQRYTQEE